MSSSRRSAPGHQQRAARTDGRRTRARRFPGRASRRALEALVFVVAVVAAVVVVTDRPRDADAEVGVVPEVVSAPTPAVSPTPGVAATSSATASPPAPPVLRLPGPVPSAGRGSFGYDDRVGPALGEAGVLRRYRVAVEAGSGEDAGEFGAAVQTALAGPGSWVDSGRLRLQQVGPRSRYDFTVYLATAATARRMCAAGGVDIRIGGRPYTSCRASGKVIINLDRWRLSVPHFVRAGVPLSVYRTYVVNHEVGHQLGHRHERCPGRGRPAPVMMQQTLFLNGCVANPWPYRDGRRFAGPPL
ncbi:DUF3152 domain-containing protein [Micromonospora sp. C28SCA-DRY-2]|uniref:DUF3152 domain-containing protein n=1 Tax=Micromonospora sp. C28SCA-DRY-2 TaxID=3059522 RepID=UPI002674453A|nr:DUF3152 domain-containing protein [Micromonospora sp. C28SCA-DRY-2]MDO3702669.1 DUF3152 domain-containing protein [Micromonospora sp. C28SCA-DRY-2]